MSSGSRSGHRPPRFFLRPQRIHPEAPTPWAELDQDNIHHLRHVLRLGPGARVLLFDGTGQEYLAEVTESRPARVELKILGSERPPVESSLRLTLAQALLKGNAFDRVLTDATELGVHAVVPILSARTVAQTRTRDEETKVRRWEKILEAAAAQCGRVLVPRIDYPTSLVEFFKRDATGLKLVLWENAPSGAVLPESKAKEIVLLVGPEGGFEAGEVEAARSAGFQVWSLGPRLLRADTAGPAAIAILQYSRGDFRCSG